jgi:hypothetical protein
LKLALASVVFGDKISNKPIHFIYFAPKDVE